MEAKAASALDSLDPRQRAFVLEYLECGLNASEAARRLHYDHPHVAGHRFVKNVNVRAAIDELLEQGKMSRPEVLQRISDKSVADMAYFLKVPKEGQPKLDLRKARRNGKLHLVKKIKFGKHGAIESIELHDPKPYLDLLARHHRIVAPKAEEGEGDSEIVLEWDDARYPTLQQEPGDEG